MLLGPIIGTMAVIFGLFAIGKVPVSFFKAMEPYLFTSYFDVWTKAFDDPISFSEVARYSLALCGFSIGFTACAWGIFARKDIVS